MKFSLFHLPTFFPEFHASEAQFYEDMLLETERADALGFHSVWFAEHHFYNYGGHIPSIAVLGAAAAQRTKQIRIGSGIVLSFREMQGSQSRFYNLIMYRYNIPEDIYRLQYG